jgi:hypothetical protein
MLSLGSFPAVTLLDARKKRTELREQIAAGIDPSLKSAWIRWRGNERPETPSVLLPTRILRTCRRTGMAEQTISKNTWLLTDLAAPIRHRSVADVKPAEILDLLEKVEASGRRDTEHRLRSVRHAPARRLSGPSIGSRRILTP